MSVHEFSPRAKFYTPHIFIRVIRYCPGIYSRARQLLSNTTMTIEQIDEAIGFRSTRRFRDIFSRHMGQAPSAYRRQA